jgi:hypothetical protein
MMRSLAAAAAVMLASLLVGGCGHGPAGTRHARAAPCPASALVLRPGPPVTEMTGEHAVMYALVNRGPLTCAVRGYPQVMLYDASGDVLPFRYAHGGGPFVTSASPVAVVLAHGSAAHVLVAKFRCDLGIAANVTSIRLTLPAAHGATFTWRVVVGGEGGSAGLSYCRGGPAAAEQLVTVSPVEPAAQAASSIR